MRKIIAVSIIVAIAVAAVVSMAYLYIAHQKSRPTLIIFCAGSLAKPFEKIAAIFEKKYNVTVYIEPSGSVFVVRKVVDLKRRCDVLGVADYRLIPKFMFPKYANWYAIFATNQIVLAFTNHSKYASYLLKHPDKWYIVLQMPGVRYGFSNPNMDPCGYRAVGVIALAALYYHNMTILKNLVISKIPGSKYKLYKNGTLVVYIPASFTPRGNLVTRPKEIDLVSLLQSGAIDYAFEYKSVAVQYHLLYIPLPPQINLGSPEYNNFYQRVIVHILVGSPEEKAIKMKAIEYGVTIPTVALHKELAIKFIELLLSPVGRRIFEEGGQPFLNKVILVGKVPPELIKFLREEKIGFVLENVTSS